jgi:hypothetical protein
LFSYGKKHFGIFNPDIQQDFLKKQIRKLFLATGITIIAILLSVLYPLAALILIGLIFLMYFLPPDNPSNIDTATE